MISAKTWRQIQKEFRWRCAYCQMPAVYLPQGLEKDHITPRSAGGSDAVRNLCTACPNCNAHKADKMFAIEPESGAEVPLFNPRLQKWTDHFEWDKSGAQVMGRTQIGKATVSALKMNLAEIVAWRRIIVKIGGYPPAVKGVTGK